MAKRVLELGAGILLESAAQERILQAVRTLLQEPSYRQGAQRISDSFKACGGAAEARTFLEEIASR